MKRRMSYADQEQIRRRRAQLLRAMSRSLTPREAHTICVHCGRQCLAVGGVHECLNCGISWRSRG